MVIGSAGILIWFGTRLATESTDYWLWASLLFLFITIISYRTDPGALSPLYCGVRNYFLPAVFLLWALIIQYGDTRFFVPISSLFIFWFFLQTWFFIEPYRFEDMKWSENIQMAGNRDSTVIPINPKGWTVVLKNPEH